MADRVNPGFSIVDFLTDKRLLGSLPQFRDLSSWRPWIAFLSAYHGLPLDAEQLELFRKHTGRQQPRAGGYPEAGVIVGRQSGKTQIAAVDGAYTAVQFNGKRRGLISPLIAQDARASMRAAFGYIREIFQIPTLAREVVREGADLIELRNGVTLACYPCRSAAVRGVRAPGAQVDEVAHFISTDGRPVDKEMIRALRPTLATTGGKLLILSSPYGQNGLLYELYTRHFGKEDSPMLIWQATAPQMNPLLPTDYLERMAEDDPEGYRSEVLGEFRAGTTSFFDSEALDAVVARDVRERAPVSGTHYVSFVDPSGGRHDAFTVSIAHRENSLAVQDVLRAWPAPFNPSAVCAEACSLLRRYRISKTTGDRYGAEFVTENFRANGVTYEPSELDRSEIYLELLPLVNSKACQLLDIPELMRELRGLERKRGTGGKDRVDHGPRGSDDRANSCAGALWLASPRRTFDIGPENWLIEDEAEAVADLFEVRMMREQRMRWEVD